MAESVETNYEQAKSARLESQNDWQPGEDIPGTNESDHVTPETPLESAKPLVTSPESEHYQRPKSIAEIEPGVGPKPGMSGISLDPSTVQSSPTDQTSGKQAAVADSSALSDEQFEAMKAQSEIERDRKLAQLRKRLQRFHNEQN